MKHSMINELLNMVVSSISVERESADRAGKFYNSGALIFMEHKIN